MRSGKSRRSHTKSRKGCSQCKQRHVKCDEAYPRCSNCDRLESNCSFSTQDASPSSLVTAAISHITVQDGSWNRPVSVEDLESLHNATQNMFSSLRQEDAITSMLINDYIRVGFAEIYVLHSTSALSASHLLSENPTRVDLFSRASGLQTLALEQVKPLLSNITQDHVMGVFIFSSFTALFAMAEAVLNPHELLEQREPISEITSCFQLARGIKVVIGPHWPYLSNSWLKPASKHHAFRERFLPSSQDYPQFGKLRDLLLQHDDEDETRAYLHALEQLFVYIAVLESDMGEHISMRVINSWPIEVETTFSELLSRRDSLASVISAHYGASMSSRPGTWWIGRWPIVLLDHIEKAVGDSWQELLRWPKQIILANKTDQVGPDQAAISVAHSENVASSRSDSS